MEIGSMTGPDDIRRSQAAGKGEDRSDELPALPCNFTVAIGAEEVGFCSLSRLSSESVAAESVSNSSEASRVIHRYSNATLRRALGRDHRLYDWRRNILAGEADKRQVTIRQFDAAGVKATHTWVLEGAWPCRWTGPAFDAAATEVAMEEIELAFERLIWR